MSGTFKRPYYPQQAVFATKKCALMLKFCIYPPSRQKGVCPTFLQFFNNFTLFY
jgi:hypothetical protein